MSKEIARVNRVSITQDTTQDIEQKFALRYDLDSGENVLAIQRLLSKSLLQDIATACHEAIEHLDAAGPNVQSKDT